MTKFCKICGKKVCGRSASGLCLKCACNTEEYILKMRINNIGEKNPMFGKKHSLDTIRKMKECKLGEKHSNYGKTTPPETRKKMSIANSGKNNPNYGKKFSKEIRKKLRLARLSQISRDKFNGNQVIPSYNPIACQRIDEYGKKFGYHFQHAMNGGEFYIEKLGYFVDGYDKEKNTVIEYYENSHDRKVQKDLDRETEICYYLSCDFIILWEKLVEI